MVDAVTVARLLGGVVLLFANGFFVTTEFALTRVRQFPESAFQGRGLRRAWEMTERLEIYLSGCQLGITISSVGLGVVAEPAVTAVLDPALVALGVGSPTATGHTAAAVIASLALINLLHVVVGEQAPTYLGIERTRFVSKYGAPPLYWWTTLMSPVIVTADRIAKGLLGLFGVDISRSWVEEELEEAGEAVSTRGEVRREMGDALQSAGLDRERREEVMGALDIGRLPVGAIDIDPDDVVALSVDEDSETNLATMRESPHVRFPLVGDGLEDFRGIVYTPRVLQALADTDPADLDFEALAARPMTVPADEAVSDLIDAFQERNQELALVTDGDDVVGLVTITDAFEAIAGEAEDPLDAETDAA